GDIHDHTLAAFDHLRRERARHAQRAEVIHFHLTDGIVEIHCDRISVTRDTGVVDKDVDCSKVLSRIHIIVAFDVQFDWSDAIRGESLQVRFLSCAGEHLTRARMRESQRQGATETATGTRNQYRLSFDLHWIITSVPSASSGWIKSST